MDPINQEMLKQAVDAARDGDYENARELVASVLENDEENVRAWLLLARLSDNIDEKRMALSTVLSLDPKNQKAKELFDKLQQKSVSSQDEADVIPGISRKLFRMILFGFFSLLFVLLVVVVFINSQQSASEENAQRTDAAQTANMRTSVAIQTGFIVNTQQAIERITEVWLTEITPTPTLTRTPTATATGTATDTRPTSLPLPQNLAGNIIAWSQEGISSSDNLPLVMFPLSGGQRNPIGDLEGRFVSISPNGRLLIYTADIGFDESVLLATIDGQELLSGIGSQTDEILNAPRMGSFSPGGQQYVFISDANDTNTTEVYLMNLPANESQLIIPTAGEEVPGSGGPPPDDGAAPPEQGTSGLFSVIRLTIDEEADYSYPIFSPDGSQILVTRTQSGGDNPGTDLVLIDVQRRTRALLTTDGDELVEAQSAWSPNGELITYSAAANGERQNDLYIISASGTGQPIPLTTSPADDVFPVYSPDGAYLAFASNRAADYNIFIVDATAREVIAQLTDLDNPTYPGAWIDAGGAQTP